MTSPTLWFDAAHSHAAAGVFLLTPDGRVVLQLRDDVPNIDNPGMITTFGGQAERHESPLDCALRELEEETGLRAAPESLRLVGAISKVNWQGNHTACVFFMLTDVDPAALRITEGRAITMRAAEIQSDPRVTDSCRKLAAAIADVSNCTDRI